MAKTMQQEMDARKAKAKKALTNGLPDDETNKALDRAHDAQFGLATHHEDIVLVSLDKLRPYANHPFKAYGEDKLNALMESIARDGLQQPIIVRKLEDTHGWEILAGHNRVEAMRLLGKQDIPTIIRSLTDDQAALVVVETNLKQREKLLPSEKAFAYKLQMEALQGGDDPIVKRGRKPSDSNDLANSVQFEQNSLSREMAADSQGVSDSEIQRYIRLTYLLPSLLDLLDQDRCPVMAGYEISFLDADTQQEIYRYFFENGAKDKLTLKHAETLRAAHQAQAAVTCESIPSILHKPKKKPGPVTYRYSQKALKMLYALPDGFDLDAFLHEKLAEAFAKTRTIE